MDTNKLDRLVQIAMNIIVVEKHELEFFEKNFSYPKLAYLSCFAHQLQDEMNIMLENLDTKRDESYETYVSELRHDLTNVIHNLNMMDIAIRHIEKYEVLYKNGATFYFHAN